MSETVRDRTDRPGDASGTIGDDPEDAVSSGGPEDAPTGNESDDAPETHQRPNVDRELMKLRRERRRKRGASKGDAAVTVDGAAAASMGAPSLSAPIRRVASPARMKRRHWGLISGFMAVVIVPLVACAIYMWVFAVDQYASTTGFTVRQEEGGGAADFLGGLAVLTGASTSSEEDILYEFIQSQNLVREIDDELDLVGHYTAPFPADPVFALWSDPSVEDLQGYWRRMVQINFDQSSGLVEVRVLAFDPEMARGIARSIVRRSQSMINDLNQQSREDSMRYAQADLEEALTRLKAAREALTSFRTSTQIVDPSADLQGRMGVMNNLQQQLAEALIEFDLLQPTTSASDTRLRRAQQRIDVIRERIAEERLSFATEEGGAGPVGEDYPTLIAEFEGLSVDREFAEETYRAALAALDVARAQAQRQSRYLATYVPPTFAETSEFPRRFVLVGIAGLFLLLTWAVMALIYYSIRDRG